MDQKVHISRDYNKFEMILQNRDVEKTKNLRSSMQQHGWIPAYPLHVIRNKSNGKLRIKAGHHRFTVARELGLPLRYIVCEDTATIHELEKATNRWTMKDYLISYMREGRAQYQTVYNYQERTGIPLQLCISMLAGQSAGSHNKINAFKTGMFELGDPTHAQIVADIVLHLKKKCKIPWGSHTFLVQAISRIVWVDDFKPTQFKKKVSTHPYLMEKQPNLESYVEMIERIYNRQSQKKIPLAFLADQVAKDRSAAYQH